ncbi:MAG: DoxX family protein [Nitrospira sp.]|uniref:DoxX family protein n=1 Tax=Nitrospira sp. BLG_1 TaxID=3395883 RepID=UPI001D702577|nr:DoxX family protein [Nitrospira sp.]
MIHKKGWLTVVLDHAVAWYGRVVWGLEALLPLFDLSVRLYLAHIFWTGGMVKLSSWISTVVLFTMVYDVPLLPPEMAAYVATAVELGGSFLLAIGLAGRWAALSLFGLNIVASISYGQVSDAALQEAFYVGMLFLYFVLHGPGLLSADTLLSHLIQRRQSKSDAKPTLSAHTASHSVSNASDAEMKAGLPWRG